MQAVEFPNLAPSVCVVCESVPPETPFVDTLNNFNPAGFTHLNGRKYLCENCVRDAANALELFDEATAPFRAQVSELSDALAQLQADADSYEAIKAAVDQLTARPVVQVETAVADAVEAAKVKRSSKRQAAAEAQKAVADAEAAAAAGAELQKQLDQEAADAQQAKVDAAATAPVVPQSDLGVASTPAADPVLGPVTPVGQVDQSQPPIDGQIWNGQEWVDPPASE